MSTERPAAVEFEIAEAGIEIATFATESARPFVSNETCATCVAVPKDPVATPVTESATSMSGGLSSVVKSLDQLIPVPVLPANG